MANCGDQSSNDPRIKAVEDLMMQYRVERAARRMGKFAILMLALVSIAAVASLFRPKYLEPNERTQLPRMLNLT